MEEDLGAYTELVDAADSRQAQSDEIVTEADTVGSIAAKYAALGSMNSEATVSGAVVAVVVASRLMNWWRALQCFVCHARPLPYQHHSRSRSCDVEYAPIQVFLANDVQSWVQTLETSEAQIGSFPASICL